MDGKYDIGNVERTSGVNIGVFSPRVTILYDLSSSLQFRGGYARGFRAPQAFNEDLHISSVGGEQRFVILTEGLDTEFSNAFTASLNYTQTVGKTQTNFLAEGFYTDLKNPFTIVSTGSVLPNGAILEEVRNGTGAYVTGTNFELGISPSSKLSFQAGGTIQRSIYKEEQVLFESETPDENEPEIMLDRFVRTPNVYGYFTTNWSATKDLAIDLTGAYTGAMIVPRVVSESGFLDLVDSDAFMDVNLKVSYHFHVLLT